MPRPLARLYVRQTGFEPAASAFAGLRSIQLSYWHVVPPVGIGPTPSVSKTDMHSGTPWGHGTESRLRTYNNSCFKDRRLYQFVYLGMVRLGGIEPPSRRWKRRVLPLNDNRMW
jgi:hypothetical protein